MMRSSWLGKLGLVAVAFVVGVLMGAAGMHRGIERRIHERMDSATWMPRTMTWLDKELVFTSEQRSQCEPIVQNAVSELVQLRDQSEAERKAILGKMFLELFAKLPSEHQRKLQELIRKGREASPGS